MEGAREYNDVFKRVGEQIERLWIASGSHARGRTLNIYVIPKGEVVTEYHPSNGYPYHDNLVEVYGIINGELGWTEQYGWLMDGKWQEDFKNIIKQRRKENALELKMLTAKKNDKLEQEQEKIKNLLSDY